MRCRVALAIAVLTLAAFNLTFRLGSESLTEWDESLYANSALDMLAGGNVAATTIFGELDYYNTKPPLAAWLIAASMHLFGPSLVAVRLPAVVAAWLTILGVLVWGWRRLGPAAAVFAALVLSTSFGFLHIHSGRSANPDAPLTLLLLLIVVVLDVSTHRPWVRVWLGPLLAGVFFLKGPAVALPFLLIVIVEGGRRIHGRERWPPLATAMVLAVAPVALWATARWRIDGNLFFKYMFEQDLVGVSTKALDDHAGPASFYVNVILKHHYDWVFAAVAVALMYPPASWRASLSALAFWRGGNPFVTVIGWWVALALIVPSLMQTKLAWYVNPLYPMFALGVGAALAYGFAKTGPPHHRPLLITMVVMASVVAESKLLVYSYQYRGIDRTVQGVLIAEAPRLAGAHVYSPAWWSLSDSFVSRAVGQAAVSETITIEEFLNRTGATDFIVLPATVSHPALVRIAVKGEYGLHRRASQLVVETGATAPDP